MNELAKTRSSLLKGVLQELEQEIERQSKIDGYQTSFALGYITALEDVWQRMGK